MSAYLEWTSDYNGFNSWKVLFHTPQLEAIAAGNPLPPVLVDTDPSNRCQQRCVYCNAYQYRREDGFHDMPPGHLHRLAHFYADWGVKATCIAGGGEPLVNPEVAGMLYRLQYRGVESAIITNGVDLTGEVAAAAVSCCRFVGISCDGATRGTYMAMRGADHLDRVRANVAALNEARRNSGSALDTNIKFLIHPHNFREIPAVARMARDLGCNGVHIRPAGLENVPGVTDPTAAPGFDRDAYAREVNELLAEAMELDDFHFHVYAVRQKFGEQLQRVVRFDQCRCTPLTGVFGADGWFHLCFSARGRAGFRLCRHYPDPYEVLRAWGGPEHKRLLAAIDPGKCMRCAFTRYNEVLQDAICRDGMFRNFL